LGSLDLVNHDIALGNSHCDSVLTNSVDERDYEQQKKRGWRCLLHQKEFDKHPNEQQYREEMTENGTSSNPRCLFQLDEQNQQGKRDQ
jgi:hypothetical protein